MSRRQRGQETRARIFRAATTALAESGYDGTAVSEICARAEVSKGAFYHHFSSKQDLFLELLERWLLELNVQLTEMHSIPSPVPEQLLAMSEMIRHVFRAAGDQLPIFLEFWAQAAHDPAVWEATITPYRRYREYFTEIVETGIAEGSLRPVDPDTTARVIVSLAVGLVLQGLLDAEGADWGHVTKEGMRMLLSGIEKRE